MKKLDLVKFPLQTVAIKQNINKTPSNYINIDYEQAYQIFLAVDKYFKMQDIQDMLNKNYKKSLSKITLADIEYMAGFYDKYESNDDGWYISCQNAIDRVLEEKRIENDK